MNGVQGVLGVWGMHAMCMVHRGDQSVSGMYGA